MFDEQDQELGPVLTLVIGIAIVISLFTIAIALSVAGVFSGGATTSGAAIASVAAASQETTKVYFGLAESTLPADAPWTLAPLVDAAKADPSRRLVLSGFHDASGDPARNAALAKDRAAAVRDALVATGIAEDRVVLEKPQEVLGGVDPKEARRVDVTLR